MCARCYGGAMSELTWSSGTWTHEPAAVHTRGTDLFVTAVEGSDAWRCTAYGHIRATEHALVAPLEGECAIEVDLSAHLGGPHDQAGVFLRASDEIWVKAGLLKLDGLCQLGVVFTRGLSDLSVTPVPGWAGQRVRIRMSRAGDALTIRAGLISADGSSQLQLVRVVPLDPVFEVEAGPYLCAPYRARLTVGFHAWRVGDPDRALHR